MTITHDGHAFDVEHIPDTDHGAPWDEHDGHGPVRRARTEDKTPGERVLCDLGHGWAYLYDIAEATRIARRDQWGCVDDRREGETLRAYRARAVEADYAFLRGWATDQWAYVGVRVTLLDEDEETPTPHTASLWGVEDTEGPYLDAVARELAEEALAQAREAWAGSAWVS